MERQAEWDAARWIARIGLIFNLAASLYNYGKISGKIFAVLGILFALMLMYTEGEEPEELDGVLE